jgi:hypothetical protein
LADAKYRITELEQQIYGSKWTRLVY